MLKLTLKKWNFTYVVQSLYSAIKKKKKKSSKDKAQLMCLSQKVINVLLLFLANWGPREDFVVGEAAWGCEAPEGETGGETRPGGRLDNSVWQGAILGLINPCSLTLLRKIAFKNAVLLGSFLNVKFCLKKSTFLFGDNY